MESTIVGKISKPVIVMVGTWDPFTPQSKLIIEKVVQDAKEKDLDSLIVLLDPKPITLVLDRYVPVLDDVPSRVELLRKEGVTAVLHIKMNKKDVDDNAKIFLDYLRGFAELKELFLGHAQSFGSGPAGSTSAIEEYCQKNNIVLHHLPLNSNLKHESGNISHQLAKGNFEDALKIAGRIPLWKKPSSGFHNVGWKTGIYKACPLKDPFSAVVAENSIEIEVREEEGRNYFTWPSPDIAWLAFTGIEVLLDSKEPKNNIYKTRTRIQPDVSLVREVIQQLEAKMSGDQELAKSFRVNPKKVLSHIGLNIEIQNEILSEAGWPICGGKSADCCLTKILPEDYNGVLAC